MCFATDCLRQGVDVGIQTIGVIFIVGLTRPSGVGEIFQEKLNENPPEKRLFMCRNHEHAEPYGSCTAALCHLTVLLDALSKQT